MMNSMILSSIIFACTLFLPCLTNIIVPTTQRRNELSSYFHNNALNYATNGNYEMALAHFRAACRLKNDSAQFWNDLGVTEMRMGQLFKAKQRFINALSIDKTYKTAEDNLYELSGYLNSQQQPSIGHGIINHNHHLITGQNSNKQRQHTILAPRELSHEEFIQLNIDYSFGNFQADSLSPLSAPFIIRDFIALTSMDTSKFSFEYLRKTYSSRQVDYYPHNMLLENAHPYFLSLGEALRQLTAPEEPFVGVDTSEPGTYIQWNLDHKTWAELVSIDDLSAADAVSERMKNKSKRRQKSPPLHDPHTGLPTFLEDSHWSDRCMSSFDVSSSFYLRTHWKMLLIGESKAGMFNHKDALRTASYQIGIDGRKLWHVCAPSEDQFLYKAGDVNMFDPDYASYPLVRQATCYEFTVDAGDFVYYPADYWHQTLDLDTPTIALTGTLATPHNYMLIAEELRKECNGSGHIFAPEPQLCADLELCYSTWTELFSDSRDNVVSEL